MKDQQSGLGSATKLSPSAPSFDCSFGMTAALIHPMGIPEPEFINGADLLGSSAPQPRPLTSSAIYRKLTFCTVIKARELHPRRLRLHGEQGLSRGCSRGARLSQWGDHNRRLYVLLPHSQPRSWVTRGEGKREKCLCCSYPGSSLQT